MPKHDFGIAVEPGQDEALDTVKVLDFGLVKDTADRDALNLSFSRAPSMRPLAAKTLALTLFRSERKPDQLGNIARFQLCH